MQDADISQCPTLAKVNADINTNKRICFNWCTFVILIMVFYFSLLALPETFQKVGERPCQTNQTIAFLNYSCLAAKNHKDVFLVKDMQERNVFLYFEFNFNIHSPGQVQANINITYNIQLYSVNVGGQNISNDQQLVNTYHDTIFRCKAGQLEGFLDCSETIIYYPEVGAHSNYLLMITVDRKHIGTDQNTTALSIHQLKNTHFTAVTVSEEFVSSLLAIKYTFLIISLFTLFFYCRRLIKINKQQWVIEQKMVLVFSILLPMFNDPFYAATILIPNRATAIIGVLFVSDFVCFMSLYQLVQLHRIVYENGQKETNAVNWFKILICLAMWVFMVGSYIIVELRFFNDPSNTYNDYDGTTFMALKITFYVIVGAILVQIVYYYVQFCRHYESRLWRYKQIGVFTIYFITSLQLFIFTGSFNVYQFDGTKVLLTIAVLNLYVYYLQYLWSPLQEGIKESETQLQTYEVMDVIRSNQSYDQIQDDEKIDALDADGIIVNEQ